MTETTNGTAPSPAISDAAVDAAAATMWRPYPTEWPQCAATAEAAPDSYMAKSVKENRQNARAALAAALPHLAQAAPPPPTTIPAISEAAVEAGAKALFNEVPTRERIWEDYLPALAISDDNWDAVVVRRHRADARAVLAAALPHLTVPAPPPAPILPGMEHITVLLAQYTEAVVHYCATSGDGTYMRMIERRDELRDAISEAIAPPPAPDGLDAFAAWFDGQHEVWVTDKHEDRGPMVRWIAGFRESRPVPASPAPAAPSDPYAMRPDEPNYHGLTPREREQVRSHRERMARTSDAYAAAQQPQEGTGHGDQ